MRKDRPLCSGRLTPPGKRDSAETDAPGEEAALFNSEPLPLHHFSALLLPVLSGRLRPGAPKPLRL